MKKILAIVFGTAIMIGAGAFGVYAEGTGQGLDLLNFGKMKEHMQQMHPGLDDNELKQMYNQCHNSGGAEHQKGSEMMDDPSSL